MRETGHDQLNELPQLFLAFKSDPGLLPFSEFDEACELIEKLNRWFLSSSLPDEHVSSSHRSLGEPPTELRIGCLNELLLGDPIPRQREQRGEEGRLLASCFPFPLVSFAQNRIIHREKGNTMREQQQGHVHLLACPNESGWRLEMHLAETECYARYFSVCHGLNKSERLPRFDERTSQRAHQLVASKVRSGINLLGGVHPRDWSVH